MEITSRPRPAPVARPRQARPQIDAARLGPGDGLQGAYDRAVSRFGYIPGVEISVCKCSGSGDKPLVILRNQQGRREGFELHIHFHGDQLSDEKQNYEGKIGPAVERAWAKNLDTVFIFPESGNENAFSRCDWRNISDIGRIGVDGVTRAGLDPAKIGTRTVSGHSSGGTVLAKALARGAANEGMAGVDRIELYDPVVSSTHNPVSSAERARVEKWCQEKPGQFVLMPGQMESGWLQYIDKSRWTSRVNDHWSPLWDSLGQQRQPG